MINERLNWWLEHNNIITPCQAGFRSNYTTEDQLIRLTQKIQNGFQMNKDTIAVFVDLEKAYDKVWRQGAKTIKKNTNSTQNKSETHHAKQYEVTSFLSTDCELSTDTCSKNVYSLGPRSLHKDERCRNT